MINTALNLSPITYASSAFLHKEVGEQLLSRLDWVNLRPNVVLDLGCGIGDCSALLQQRYPEAKVVGVDIQPDMLHYAKGNGFTGICGDVMMLPFQDNSVDLLFANLMLPWCSPLEKLLQEWHRVLRPEGLLLFTCLGPDTLSCWRTILGSNIIPQLIDMHDVGDLLIQTKFVDPVLDVECIELHYRQAEDLFREFQATGIVSPTFNFVEYKNAFNKNENGLTKYEVIYGLAWGAQGKIEQGADEFGTVKFPLSHLRRRL